MQKDTFENNVKYIFFKQKARLYFNHPCICYAVIQMQILRRYYLSLYMKLFSIFSPSLKYGRTPLAARTLAYDPANEFNCRAREDAVINKVEERKRTNT